MRCRSYKFRLIDKAQGHGAYGNWKRKTGTVLFLGNDEGRTKLFLDRSLHTFASSIFHLIPHRKLIDLSQTAPRHCF